jgi:hypothetical protein
MQDNTITHTANKSINALACKTYGLQAICNLWKQFPWPVKYFFCDSIYLFFIYSLFNDTFSSCTALNEMMVSKLWIGRHVEGSSHGPILGTTQYLNRGTKENHEKPQTGWPVAGSIFEPGTSWLWCRYANHYQFIWLYNHQSWYLWRRHLHLSHASKNGNGHHFIPQ